MPSSQSKYPISLKGFGSQKIELEVSGVLGNTRILVNGIPAEKGNRQGEFILYYPDGDRVSLYLQNTFFDIIPKIQVNGQIIEILPPITWIQYMIAGLGFILIFSGGGIGGLLGMVSFIINIRLLRSIQAPVLRYLSILFINMLAIFLFNLISRNFPTYFF
jgi:hypothetical protein